jgi:hypothetical protein
MCWGEMRHRSTAARASEVRHWRPGADARPSYRTDRRSACAGSARTAQAQHAACKYRYLLLAARARDSADRVAAGLAAAQDAAMALGDPSACPRTGKFLRGSRSAGHLGADDDLGDRSIFPVIRHAHIIDGKACRFCHRKVWFVALLTFLVRRLMAQLGPRMSLLAGLVPGLWRRPTDALARWSRR